MDFKLCKSPIFIIGLPRSGTKLFREILNNHNNIFIPKAESLFIPFLVKKYGLNPNFDILQNQVNLKKDLVKSVYCINMSISYDDLNNDKFNSILKTNSWQYIFQFLFDDLVNKTKKNIIYGDKSPSYINHLPLLYKIFPDANFLHIIRDPRDQALSIKKAWNKSVYLSASNWYKSIISVKNFVSKNKINYLEFKYEDLIINPRPTLELIFDFINLEFNLEMLNFNDSIENVGEAKGLKSIKNNNFNKFRNHLTKNQIKKIELLTFPIIKSLNYNLDNKINYHKDLNKIEQFLFYLYDFIFHCIYHLKDKGLFKGLLYLRGLNQSNI